MVVIPRAMLLSNPTVIGLPRPRARKRLFLAASISLSLLTAACTGGAEDPAITAPSPEPSPAGQPSSTGQSSAPSGDVIDGGLARIACDDVAREALVRVARGIHGDRSGDVQMIPIDPNFVSAGLSHASPFDVTQDVPLFLYGPGYVKPGVYHSPVTLADIAPTTAALLKFPFDARDGSAQRQALLPEAERGMPALVVTLVWDSAGMDVLERWNEQWPFLRSLLIDGAWFTNASTGSSPSNTPPAHATIGTGAFPSHHGFVDEFIRLKDELEKPNQNGPAFLLEPTLGDLFDVAMGNEPKVGAVATLASHVMMMSHGSLWGGSDVDLAITRELEGADTGGAETVRWNLTSGMAPYYHLPAYANELPPLSVYAEDLDRSDGSNDGLWRDNDIAQLEGGFYTPARTPFQQTLVEEVIEREGFGTDDVTDLLYLNYKAIDMIGHLFSTDGIEMSDGVQSQDDALEQLVSFLDERVGQGRWVMVLTADHGAQRDPNVVGAFPIDIGRLKQGLTKTFDDDGDDVPLLVRMRPTQAWLDRAELADNGVTLRDISEWFLGLTQQEVFKSKFLHSEVTLEPGHENDPVFAAALPSRSFARLPCLSGAGA
jgi:Type I phosphodiesterase / nucleotide pyrophosphatase